MGIFDVTNKHTDKFGFTALPGGRRYYGKFDEPGMSGLWWTSTEVSPSGSGEAYYRIMSSTDDNVRWGSNTESTGYSVRCLKD